MPRHALIVQHVAHEALAGFALPLAEAGYDAEILLAGSEAFSNADLISPDLLILLGGPMGVYETARYPWMQGEIDRVAGRLRQRRPTLGICLGAQVIAAALGAKVAPGSIREVGFAPLLLAPEGEASPLAALADVSILHWHGDGFSVPGDATLLASTAAYPQAFAIGSEILALQCHPEMGGADDNISGWVEDAEAYIESAGSDAERLLADHFRLGAAASMAGATMFEAWLGGLPE